LNGNGSVFPSARFLAATNGSLEPLERPLVLQVAPAALIESTKNFFQSPDGAKMRP